MFRDWFCYLSCELRFLRFKDILALRQYFVRHNNNARRKGIMMMVEDRMHPPSRKRWRTSPRRFLLAVASSWNCACTRAILSVLFFCLGFLCNFMLLPEYAMQPLELSLCQQDLREQFLVLIDDERHFQILMKRRWINFDYGVGGMP